MGKSLTITITPEVWGRIKAFKDLRESADRRDEALKNFFSGKPTAMDLAERIAVDLEIAGRKALGGVSNGQEFWDIVLSEGVQEDVPGQVRADIPRGVWGTVSYLADGVAHVRGGGPGDAPAGRVDTIPGVKDWRP